MKRQNNKGTNLLIIVLCALLAFITILFVTVLLLWKKESTTHIELKPEFETEEESTEETEGTEESETEATEEIVEEPTYKFTEEHVEVRLSDLDREYRIAWVSDLHMITDLTAADDILEEDLEQLRDRYENFAVDENGVHAVEIWPEIVKYLNAGKFDAVIFGGDMLDYCSESNIKTLKEGMEKIKPPVLYLRADHDYGYGYGGDAVTEETTHKLQATIDGDDLEKKYLDFGDFEVVGINSSTKNFDHEHTKAIIDLLENGKKAILATHVPFYSDIPEEEEKLEKLSMKVRNTIYYWSGPNYIPNEDTQMVLDKIYWKHSPIREVVCGHLHAEWDGMLYDKVGQHIFAPAFQGHVGVITVVPKDEE